MVTVGNTDCDRHWRNELASIWPGEGDIFRYPHTPGVCVSELLQHGSDLLLGPALHILLHSMHPAQTGEEGQMYNLNTEVPVHESLVLTQC